MTLPDGDEENRDHSKDSDDKSTAHKKGIEMSDLDKKKYLIDRIERQLDTVIKEKESRKMEDMAEVDSVENQITFYRNAVLTATSFAASIIVGVSALDRLEQIIILQLLAADIIIGLTAFIVSSLIKGRVQDLRQSLDKSYARVLIALDTLVWNIAGRTFDIDDIPLLRLYFYRNYAAFAAVAVEVKILSSLDKISKSWFFRNTSLPKLYTYRMRVIDESGSRAEFHRNYFGKWADDLEYMKIVHRDFFNRYGYEVEESGNIVKRTK